MGVELFLANRLPWLGPFRRLAAAAWHAAASPRQSYSQYGEDRWVAERLASFSRGPIAYLDVGANHPTRISNTYALYRMGFHGVVVEPNLELVALHRRFRPRDVALAVACGAAPAIATLEVSSTPVLSRISTGGSAEPQRGSRVLRTEAVPLLPLDVIARDLAVDRLPFLSVDTEGHDLQVLRSGDALLSRTWIISVEYSGAEDEEIDAFLDARYEKAAQFGCNGLFVNRSWRPGRGS